MLNYTNLAKNISLLLEKKRGNKLASPVNFLIYFFPFEQINFISFTIFIC